ncbi:MAG TPA: YlbF family regulator [Candidatus Angelobacter sp.]|nr:YlbF family regulator [Candidatus Angelobacter sp.]
MSIIDTANELEKQIRQSQEYSALKKAYQEVERNQQAKRLFDSFKQVQLQLQQKQQLGQPLSQADAQAVQGQLQLIQGNPLIAQLMLREQQMGRIIEQINQIITKPLQELYQNPNQ